MTDGVIESSHLHKSYYGHAHENYVENPTL